MAIVGIGITFEKDLINNSNENWVIAELSAIFEYMSFIAKVK